MLESYAVRITYGKEVVKHIIAVWATQCEKILAFEHTDAQKIHCHLLVIGSRVCKKQLRNIAKNCGVDLKGNANMAFKSYDANETYITYMSKGKFSPFYLQGFTQEECEEAKKMWVPRESRSPMKELYKRFEVVADLSSQAFAEHVEQTLRLHPREAVLPGCRFEWVRSKAHAIAFHANDSFATGKFFSDYKMLVYTFCFRNGIPIPMDWKGNY